MISLYWCVVTATANSAKQFALRLRVSHEPVITTTNRQVLKALHQRMVRSNLVVVIIKILDDRILLIGVRVTLREVLQRLVEAIAVAMVVIASCLNNSSPVAGHGRDALIRLIRIIVTAAQGLLHV